MQENETNHRSPVPRFRFNVNWGTLVQDISFQEVTGLQIDKQVKKPGFFQTLVSIFRKVLGLRQPGVVTLTNVIVPSDWILKALYDQVNQKEFTRQRVMINLLDEEGNAVLTWTLKNAWIRKLSFSNLKSNANELADYTIELVHHGIELDVANLNSS